MQTQMNFPELASPSPRVDLKMKSTESRDKPSRGNAIQFFIAGELCRRGYSAVVTLWNTPNVDILCSNQQGTRFAHIQVKTFVPGNRTCSVGMKAMKNVGPTFFWILGGIPLAGSDRPFEYYVISYAEIDKNVSAAHKLRHFCRCDYVKL